MHTTSRTCSGWTRRNTRNRTVQSWTTFMHCARSQSMLTTIFILMSLMTAQNEVKLCGAFEANRKTHGHWIDERAIRNYSTELNIKKVILICPQSTPVQSSSMKHLLIRYHWARRRFVMVQFKETTNQTHNLSRDGPIQFTDSAIKTDSEPLKTRMLSCFSFSMALSLTATQ